MGILRLTKPVSSEFECEVVGDNVKNDVHLVRPCERYKELLKSCKSVKGRLHQYYVYGELFDCNDLKQNYQSCLDYRKTKNIDELDPIIKWETCLINARTKATLANPTWEFRDTPPEDFDGPLPEFIRKRQRFSSFSKETVDGS